MFLSLLSIDKLRFYAKIKKTNTFHYNKLPVSTVGIAGVGQLDCNILKRHFYIVFINIYQLQLSNLNIFDRNLFIKVRPATKFGLYCSMKSNVMLYFCFRQFLTINQQFWSIYIYFDLGMFGASTPSRLLSPPLAPSRPFSPSSRPPLVLLSPSSRPPLNSQVSANGKKLFISGVQRLRMNCHWISNKHLP